MRFDIMVVFNNLSIKIKLILIILLVSFFTLIIGFAFVIVTDIINFKSDMKNYSIVNAKLIGEYCAVSLAFDVKDNAVETLEQLKAIPSIDVGIVYNEKNEVFAEFFNNEGKENIPEIPEDRTMSRYEGNNLHIFQPILYDNKIAGAIYLKVSTEILQSKIRKYLFTSAILLLVTLVITYLLAVWLQSYISRPIINLTDATKRIYKDGDYSVRVEKTGNDEIGTLVDEYNNMLTLIQSREVSLNQRTIELSGTLEHLKNAQGKLIESEKMAALGQLIAGVAHEVNTPLGAIRSSVGNINNSISTLLTDFPDFIQKLPEDQRSLFFSLIEEALKNQQVLTSKEERQNKRVLTKILEKNFISNSYQVADTLVDMGIDEELERFIPLFTKIDSESILKMAYKLTGLKRSTQNITTATDRASKVVFALRNFTRIDHSGEMVMTNIIDGIETVITLYYNQLKQGVEVIRNFSEIPQIMCYADELIQIWTNIIHNAIQAMTSKGTLNIEVKEKDNYIIAAFTDNGSGIPPEIKDKIFQPFFTTKPAGEGSGLGLDIVKRIIDKHQGKIEVESVPGKTTFSIYLPKV